MFFIFAKKLVLKGKCIRVMEFVEKEGKKWNEEMRIRS
jgi:hypothetical protein